MVTRPARGARIALAMASLLGAPLLPAHEGDSEERALRLLGQLQQLERSWVAVVQENNPLRRESLLLAHGQALLAVQATLRIAADKSPCVLLEANDAGRQLACLVDTEARLRATERVLAHVVNRVALAGK